MRYATILSVREIDDLTALGARQGATLLPTLRGAWSGETLGHGYADATKAIHIEEHRYRLCLLLGAQPERAGQLLAEADGGTPQRFLWFPTNDPDVTEEIPEEPEPAVLVEYQLTDQEREQLRAQLSTGHGAPLMPIEVCQAARQYIDKDRLRRLRAGITEGGEHGHATLLRLKTAAGLMALDGRHDKITDEDWDLAGIVCDVSSHTFGQIERALGDKHRRENVGRGRAAGVRQVAAADVEHEERVKRCADNIRNQLAKKSPQTTRELKKRARPEWREHYVPQALDRLVDAGIVQKMVHRGVSRYALN